MVQGEANDQKQAQQLQAVLQILDLLKGQGGVQLLNPNLGYNYKGATTAHGYAGTLGTQIAQQLIPGPMGAIAAPFIGDFIQDLVKPASSTLPWKNNYINPMGMSSQGFMMSTEYRKLMSQYQTVASTALNDAYRTMGGNKAAGGALDSWLQFFGLDQNQRKATQEAVKGSMSVLAARNGIRWGDDRFKTAATGIADAVAGAATGRYYGNFGGQQIGILAQHLAAQGAFDADAEDVQHGAENIRSKLQHLSRALQPLRDIFGNDIKMMIASLQTLYGTGISAVGQQRLSQLSSDIRGTMYATGANMKVLAQAQKAAAQHRQAMVPGSSGNIVFNDINNAMTYTMRTSQAQSSAFMSTDQYRRATMADIVGTATSQYADTANKAYGMWAMNNVGQNDIQQFQDAIHKQMANGLTYQQAMLKLAGVGHATQLRRTSYSDYAQRSGFGARIASAEDYNRYEQQMIAAKTMWLDGTQAQEARNALGGQDRRHQIFSTIFSLNGDRQSVTKYLNSMGISDTGIQQLIYDMAVDNSRGTSLAARAHAYQTQRKAKQRRQAIDDLMRTQQQTQADNDRASGGSAGIWGALKSGQLKKGQIQAAFNTLGLDINKDFIILEQGDKVTNLAGGNTEFGRLFNRLDDQQKAKFISSIPQYADKLLGSNGNIDVKKAQQFLVGRQDTQQFINSNIKDPNVRTAFTDKLTKGLEAAKNKAKYQGDWIKAVQKLNKDMRDRVNQYNASLHVGDYQGVNKDALAKVQAALAKGRSLQQLQKDNKFIKALNDDGDGDEPSAKDKQDFKQIHTLIKSQGKDQNLLYNLLQPIVEPLRQAIFKFIGRKEGQ